MAAEPTQHADCVAYWMAGHGLACALQNYREKAFEGRLVAGDDDWARDVLAAWKTLPVPTDPELIDGSLPAPVTPVVGNDPAESSRHSDGTEKRR